MKKENRIGDAPIDKEYHAMMNAIAQALDEMLNKEAKGDDRKTGFVLLVFPFEGNDGRCNYISNAERKDVVTMMKEQIARFEGQPEMKGTA
jgi:hypothetical protein